MNVVLAVDGLARAFAPAMNRDERIKAKERAEREALSFRTAFAKRLVDARRAANAGHGMTQMELAHASGISLASLQGYESGRREPHFVTAYLLAKSLGMTPQELLFGAQAKKAPHHQG